MRSTVPMEGNPWPHDMVITVEDGSQQLLELLWLREAWGLQPVGNLPPRLVDEPERAGDSDDREAWETAWPEVWQEAANHAAVLVEPSMFDELQRTGNGSLERAELLRRMVGPTWRDRFGDDAFDEHYQEWTRRRFEARRGAHQRPLAETPERRSLDALIAAWRAGLSKVVTIPCRGDYTRVLGGSALLLTDAARNDPDRYSSALTSFAAR